MDTSWTLADLPGHVYGHLISRISHPLENTRRLPLWSHLERYSQCCLGLIVTIDDELRNDRAMSDGRLPCTSEERRYDGDGDSSDQERGR